MSTSFHISNMDEHEKNLMTGTLEQRKEAFKKDEELMRETTKFISEVIETAATEASKRKTQSEGADAGEGSRLKGGDTIAGWNNRARGFCNRILNALCPCFTNHDCRHPLTIPSTDADRERVDHVDRLSEQFREPNACE